MCGLVRKDSVTKLPRFTRSSFATPYSSPYAHEAVHLDFGHQVGILFHHFVNHKTLNFATPGKSDKNKRVEVCKKTSTLLFSYTAFSFESSVICFKAYYLYPGFIYEIFNKISLLYKAGVQGLEPRYSGPKPDVLPLDDTPAL